MAEKKKENQKENGWAVAAAEYEPLLSSGSSEHIPSSN